MLEWSASTASPTQRETVNHSSMVNAASLAHSHWGRHLHGQGSEFDHEFCRPRNYFGHHVTGEVYVEFYTNTPVSRLSHSFVSRVLLPNESRMRPTEKEDNMD